MDPDPPPNCEYSSICKFYTNDCYEEYCYRKFYFEGMINDLVKDLIKENKLEKILNGK